MSAVARRWSIAVLLVAAVGAGIWSLMSSTTCRGRGEARARFEATTADAKPAVAPTSRRRDKTETDATPATEDVADARPEQRPETLTIHVLSADDDAPIASATVRAMKDYGGRETIATATSDATGVARITIEQGLDSVRDFLVRGPGFVQTRCDVPDRENGGDAATTVRLKSGTFLDGVVVDAKTGAPLAGARVVAEFGGERNAGFGLPELPYADVVTGADGKFRLDGIPTAGTTSVNAEAEGRVGDSVDWDGDLSRRIELRLEPTPPGVIRGVVRDAAGAPVKGILVRAKRPDSFQDDAKTNADGAYEITGLAVDRAYVVWADDLLAKPPFSTAVAADVRLTADAPAVVRDLVLVRPAELLIRVRDKDGKPVEGAQADVATLHASWQVTLDATGDATVVLARPGDYQLAVVAAGFVRHDEKIEVVEGTKRTVTVVLDRGEEISGVVVDDVGAPVVDVIVCGSPDESGQWDTTTRTGADGAFRLTGCLTTKPYRVTARDDDESMVETSAPKDGLRLTTTRRGTIAFLPKAPPGTYVGISFASIDGTRSFAIGRQWYGDPLEPLDVPAATYDVVFSVAGFAPVARRVVLAPGASVDLGEIAFDRGVALAGRVVDPDGRPVAGARVTADVGGEREGHVAWTDASGAFRLFRLPTGIVSIVVVADGFVDGRVGCFAAVGARPTVVTLSRGGVLKGRILDPGRRHDPTELVVGAWDSSSNMSGEADSAEVDEHGAFALRLAPGSWRLRVRGRTSLDLGTKDVEVREGEDTSVEIDISR